MEKVQIDYLFVIHRLFYNGKRKKGGADIILEYLVAQEKSVGLLEFNIAGKLGVSDSKFITKKLLSKFSLFRNNKESIFTEFVVIPKKEPFRWVAELFYFIRYVVKYTYKPIPVTVGVDPLCTFFAVILRYLGLTLVVYHHLIDYSENRFQNRLLNLIYLKIHYFAAVHADVVGVVSKRIFNKLLEEGVKPEKIFYIPNSPCLKTIPYVIVQDRYPISIVICAAAVVERYRFTDCFQVIASLKKDFPALEVHVIAETQLEASYFTEIKNLIFEKQLKDNVIFYGFLEKEKAQDILARCLVGLVLYSDKYSHVNYGDSLKMREYAAAGLPIVTDRVTSTAEEAKSYGAAFVCDTLEELRSAITSLWRDSKLYKKMSDNAINWAKEFDKENIMIEWERTVGNITK